MKMIMIVAGLFVTLIGLAGLYFSYEAVAQWPFWMQVVHYLLINWFIIVGVWFLFLATLFHLSFRGAFYKILGFVLYGILILLLLSVFLSFFNPPFALAVDLITILWVLVGMYALYQFMQD